MPKILPQPLQYLSLAIKRSAFNVAQASKGNPIISLMTVCIFFLMFSMIEDGVETLIFGDVFTHWLDPIFGMAFMAYSAMTVWGCAVYQETMRNRNEKN